MRQIVLILLILSNCHSFAQGNQSEYLEAKRLYTSGNYRDAMAAFQSLTFDSEFGTYATFYYALSAYQQGLSKVALDGWKQLRLKHPDWDQITEVNFWIAKASFDQKRYFDGVRYAYQIPEKLRLSLFEEEIQQADLEALEEAFQSNKTDKRLAKLYFDVLLAIPYDQRDNEMVLQLSDEFGFELVEIVKDLPVIKKDQYAVALVLPFMFDSLQSPQSVIRNRIIFDFYEGMVLARDSLDSLGIDLELFPYDTKKDRNVARQIVANGWVEEADVIVGPLYPGPNEVVLSYSNFKQLPVINPLSSNGDLLEDNKYTYLFKPDYQTQGRVAGEFAVANYQDNKTAMILFESERDMIRAKAYREVIQADSFDIVLFEELTKETGLKIQADFTEQFEYAFDTLSQKEIDSIALLPGRYVRSRVMRDSLTGRVLKDAKGEDLLQYYEMQFNIRKDTIGHIFVASSSNLLANNILSMAEVRGDSIGIIGYDDWLNFRQVSYGQLERLEVAMINTNLFSKNKDELERKVIERFVKEPSQYHLMGFELIMQLGRLFNEHGKHFQRGLMIGRKIDGFLMEGLKYGTSRTNQVVPIVTMKNLQLIIQNQESYED